MPCVRGTGVQVAVSLQWMAAQLPDRIRPGARASILEFDRTDVPFRQAVLTAPIDHEYRTVAIADGAGLGIDMDRNALTRFSPVMRDEG